MSEALATLREDEGAVVILDQTRLPGARQFCRLSTLEQAAEAIRVMRVRGAPLIGATAAYGVALGLAEEGGDTRLDHVLATLGATRPTAVNLHWALDRMAAVLRPLPAASRRAVAWTEARAIAAEDAAANGAIGVHGLALLQEIHARNLALPGAGHSPTHDIDCVNVMTHCNAGWLATVAHGTALAPVYAAREAGLPLHVWVSETRPRNQGLLTAWELDQAGAPHTVIADNAAGLLLMQGRVDCVIVGADRIAANGDTANKVGTYLKALAARAHGVPFYVAAPLSTIDFACFTGGDIPIEERDGNELGHGLVPVANPAFDVTPAALITAIITERGVCRPDQLASLQP
ncbi:S-methyl-5-thioribose-1-phosphate isomerase [Denitratisoma oestradiolicum]|uniref:Methylthioribose-1-phosphate isomerase n=1 Tax=Denitratisoma oestradiolicum TaxID=311182 RepID=A0A6S6XYV3_9PROT|nr:S-methyl-5-thioribose-1-phosphate isomerase [Denitratisoma oestradiolicum]TWO80417.1 S-methyl-5-thioribose-1-phosphate isomerase [Denitratisoma oestradiolicum]CAB1370228.1 Methylthioribose-1-phosphate isomerase [Denitratisoma oestradiolicum]